MQKDLTIFEEVNELLTCEDVAKTYGLNVRNHKTHCIFHDEKTPSLSFKKNFFNCFGCGTKGTVINLTMKLLELDSPLEAVKKLNDDFHLELNLNSKRNNIKQERRNYNLEIIKEFDKWWNNTFNKILNDYHFYKEIIEILSPKNENELNNISDLYLEAINNTDYYDYLLDCMIKCENNYEEKAQFYQFYSKEGYNE